MRNAKDVPVAEREAAIKRIIEGGESRMKVAKETNINYSTLYHWCADYMATGYISVPLHSEDYKQLSATAYKRGRPQEVKEQIIQDVLAGFTYVEIAAKYGVLASYISSVMRSHKKKEHIQAKYESPEEEIEQLLIAYLTQLKHLLKAKIFSQIKGW